MFIHGSINFVIKNRSTRQAEGLRRNHNWYASEKVSYDAARKKEARRFKKEWNLKGGRCSDCISVSVS